MKKSRLLARLNPEDWEHEFNQDEWEALVTNNNQYVDGFEDGLERAQKIVDDFLNDGKLKKLLDKQAELDERIREERDLSWEDPQDELNDLCTAMSNEVEELRDLTSWKWWADDTRIDYDEATEELIDVLHFWLSAANLLGMDAGTIMETYLGKNETNHERQEQGY